MSEWLGAIALVWFTLVRPDHHRCAVGSPEGIRPSGETRCLVPPSGRGDDECVSGGRCSFPVVPRFGYAVRIYCTGGAHPIVVDARTVGCQR